MIGETAEEVSPSTTDGDIVIIGNRGRMGAMLEKRAREAGIKTIGLDQPLKADATREAAKNAKIILFCIPAKIFEKVLADLTPVFPKNAILADITSVKEMPMRLMRKYWQGPIVGTHPLFGPGVQDDDEKIVAMIADEDTSKEDFDKVASFFTMIGFKLFTTTAKQHDEAMAKIQNMNFITNLAYFAALAGQKELLPFLTPSFNRRKNAASKMLNEDAEMFAGLFEANPHSHESVRQYRKMLNLAASGDIELLCKRAQWWWKDEISEP